MLVLATRDFAGGPEGRDSFRKVGRSTESPTPGHFHFPTATAARYREIQGRPFLSEERGALMSLCRCFPRHKAISPSSRGVRKVTSSTALDTSLVFLANSTLLLTLMACHLFSVQAHAWRSWRVSAFRTWWAVDIRGAEWHWECCENCRWS